ncbi:MAG: ROK family transcriptional regulator [Actinobacteria bacterium]|nr:ROK family transcriptional regulator [Actinomycetota bacterium]
MILDVVRASRTISRVELATATGLTQATVSTVVRRLIDEGLVVEVGRGASTGGKPRTLLAIEPTARYALGVQLGTDGTTFVLADLGGAIVSRWRRGALVGTDPGHAVGTIAAEVDGIVERSGIDRRRLTGLGVVAPGPLQAGTRIVLAQPPMTAWVDFPVRERLEAATRLPVLLDNDATATAAGLYWADGIAPTTTLAALFMGQGVGAGLLTGGRVFRGASGNAGEVGHVTVDLDGPVCWCGNRGCVEALAGPAAVVERARAAGVDLGDDDRPVLAAFGALARLALAGDRVALDLVEDSARYLAVAAHTLVNVVDPDLLVLTGPAFAVAGPLYLPVVAQHVADHRFARGSGPVQVRLSTHGPESAALGAATLVLQAELAPRGAEAPLS